MAQRFSWNLVRTLSLPILATAVTACQTAPTKVMETPSPVNESLAGLRPLIITEKTIILDARPFFQYSGGHVPRAIAVDWRQFSRPGSPYRGELDTDLRAITRRLAAWGVSPDSHVVVVGESHEPGEENTTAAEGRVAWMLKYLGVRNVEIVSELALKRTRTLIDTRPASIPVWEAIPETDLSAAEAEVRALQKGKSDSSTVLVDVTTGPNKNPLPNSKLIAWPEFVDGDGRPNPAIVTKLASLGITKAYRIFFVSDDGVGSALATVVARELGFSRATNYAPGIEQLGLSSK